MLNATTVKVSGRYQISLPSYARKSLNIEAGDRLLVDVQDGMLILIPKPKDFVQYMRGLHQDVWKNLDTTIYLNEERAAWEPSSSS